MHSRRTVKLTLLTVGLLAVFSIAALSQGRTSNPSQPALPSPSADKNMKGMTMGQAFVLGIVEGLTEYLPVSSTGHLLIAERVMHIGEPQQGAGGSKEAADAYAVCIQAGAIIAVLGLYFNRFKQMGWGILGHDRQGLRMAINLVAAFMPAAFLGLILHKFIKSYLFGPWPVVLAWFTGGLGIFAVSRWQRNRARERREKGKTIIDMNVRMALVIGFAQCAAMWPGVSRSLATIVGGMFVGLSMESAVEFSFLLGMVTLGAATVFDAVQHGQQMINAFDPISLLAGLIVAFASAVISIKWMLSYLNRHGLDIFGYYRIALAIIGAILIFAGIF